MKALVLGGASYDHIIQLGEFPTKPIEALFAKGSYFMVGGTGSGKALNLARLGFDVTFQYRIGKDEAGEKIKAFMDAQPLISAVEYDNASTECHTNLMDDHGGRTSIYTQYLTFEPKLDKTKVLGLLESSDFVVINIMNYCRQYIADAQRMRKPIWIDIHDYDGINEYHDDFIRGAEYMFMSSQNMTDYRSFMEAQVKAGKKLVVCTHGKRGATCLTDQGDWYEQPIFEQFERVDTNGAGDAFMSGFICGYQSNEPIQRCMEFGAIAAGMAVTNTQLYGEDLSPSSILKYSEI